jgi:hypothetical protein
MSDISWKKCAVQDNIALQNNAPFSGIRAYPGSASAAGSRIDT